MRARIAFKKSKKTKRSDYSREHDHLIEDLQASFMLNIPVHVPADMDGESSVGSESDKTYEHEIENFNPDDYSTYPFRTFALNKKGKKGKKGKKNSAIEELEDKPIDSVAPGHISDEIRGKIISEGFSNGEGAKDYVALVVGLNRPKSISTRKNDSLLTEVRKPTTELEDDIHHREIAFFWEVEWYKPADAGKKQDIKVNFEDVKKFYKLLKLKNPEHANRFLEENELGLAVPYQAIREAMRSHSYSSELVGELRKSGSEDVYFCMMDSDTLDFNGVFSRYLKIAKSKDLPVVMSTGYNFPDGEGDHPFHIQSIVEMESREIIALHADWGVYYPEPNTCILIPKDCDMLPETFKGDRKSKALESAILLEKVLQRGAVKFIFDASENPIVTSIPPRAREFRGKKIEFSKEFIEEGEPNAEDFEKLKYIAQSSFKALALGKSLYVNRAFKLSDPAKFNKIVNDFIFKEEEGEIISRKLFESLTGFDIPEDKARSIVNGLIAFKNYYLRKLEEFGGELTAHEKLRILFNANGIDDEYNHLRFSSYEAKLIIKISEEYESSFESFIENKIHLGKMLEIFAINEGFFEDELFDSVLNLIENFDANWDDIIDAYENLGYDLFKELISCEIFEPGGIPLNFPMALSDVRYILECNNKISDDIFIFYAEDEYQDPIEYLMAKYQEEFDAEYGNSDDSSSCDNGSFDNGSLIGDPGYDSDYE